MKITKAIKLKLPETHEEWLQNRQRGIGGSDAGAIAGYNKYKSPYKLWCEKTGIIDGNVEDNESMRLGRDLEQYVADRWMEITGKKCHKSGFSYQSKDYPFMLANVDRLVVGEDAGLEIKTANVFATDGYKSNDIPPQYYFQCLHYMLVTGFPKWYLCVLVFGQHPFTFDISIDQPGVKEDMQALLEMEKDFWNCVETNEPPAIDGSKSTSEALEERYKDTNDESVVFPHSFNTEFETLEKVKNEIAEKEKEKKEIENKIKEKMGVATEGMTDEYSFSWKPYISKRIDSKKLKEEYPDVYADVLKEGSSRPFKYSKLRKPIN